MVLSLRVMLQCCDHSYLRHLLDVVVTGISARTSVVLAISVLVLATPCLQGLQCLESVETGV